MIIEINDKEYNVEVASTDEEKAKGLQHVESLRDNEGMIFVYDEPQEVSFWMVDTEINLDIIFIDEDWEIIRIATGYAQSDKAHTCENVKYVLELKQGSGISKGDDVDLSSLDEDFDTDEDGDEKLPDAVMKVLDSKGKSQMDLEGGERIFSRKHTKILIRFAKKAYKSKSDRDYKALGTRIFKYINYQNNKDEDYVNIKD